MSQALGISTKTGYKLIRENKIESLKVGRSYRIPKAQPSFVYAFGYEIPTDFVIAHWTSARKKRHLLHGAILPKCKWKTEKQMDFNQASGKGEQEESRENAVRDSSDVCPGGQG